MDEVDMLRDQLTDVQDILEDISASLQDFSSASFRTLKAAFGLEGYDDHIAAGAISMTVLTAYFSFYTTMPQQLADTAGDLLSNLAGQSVQAASLVAAAR